MVIYDRKETRANRHSRKVTLRLPFMRQVRFLVTQSSSDGVYDAPVITMEPNVFAMQSSDELDEFKIALTRAHEIFAEMKKYTGTKVRGGLKELLS